MANNPLLDSQLWAVVRNNDVAGFEGLLKKGADPNIKSQVQLGGSRNGLKPVRETLYDVALAHDAWDVFAALLKHKVRLPPSSVAKAGVWEKAIEELKSPAVRLLMEHQACYGAAFPTNKHAEPPLVTALRASRGDREHPVVLALMKRPGKWDEPRLAALAEALVDLDQPVNAFLTWVDTDLNASGALRLADVQKRVWTALAHRPESQTSVVLDWMRALVRHGARWRVDLDSFVPKADLARLQQKWEASQREVTLESLTPSQPANGARRLRP